MSIFKACDIRGIVGDTLTVEMARSIGNATVRILNCQSFVVGYDMRVSSEALTAAFIEGVIDSGCDVVTIGLVPTEVCYFAISHLDTDGGVMITASHNPSNYNGFKICSAGSMPVDYTNGIGAIQQLVETNDYYYADKRGSVSKTSIIERYIEHIFQFESSLTEHRIVIDTGNGMAGCFMPAFVQKYAMLDIVKMYWELDGTFPNHGPNPMLSSNTHDLRRRVVEEGADLGIAFDGDSDRIVFIDECGTLVPQDVLLMLVAEQYLTQNENSAVVYDLRCSNSVAEFIHRHHGRAVLSKVGHTNVKLAMRKHNAVFAGELSGHYYFRENFYSDSSLLMMLRILEVLSRSEKTLSQMVAEHRPYYSSGELSFIVDDKYTVFDVVEKEYQNGEHSSLDGLTVRYPDWWFNLRKSITEPCIRLNIEANRSEVLEREVSKLTALIESVGSCLTSCHT